MHFNVLFLLESSLYIGSNFYLCAKNASGASNTPLDDSVQIQNWTGRRLRTKPMDRLESRPAGSMGIRRSAEVAASQADGAAKKSSPGGNAQKVGRPTKHLSKEWIPNGLKEKRKRKTGQTNIHPIDREWFSPLPGRQRLIV